MMKTLYIHGLDSSPKPEKIRLIKPYSNVSALHLDYKNQPDSFEILSALIQKEAITHIIGSSLGGYLGFWLGEKYGLPVLLFNPAIGMQNKELNIFIKQGQCPYRIIVLGAKDDRVPPNMTYDFLKKYDHNHTTQRIVECNKLGHQIDLQTFEEFVVSFYATQNLTNV